jgi:predicted SprT family Zn-dependent metalloprotease
MLAFLAQVLHCGFARAHQIAYGFVPQFQPGTEAMARKRHQSHHRKGNDPAAITPVEYGGLQAAFSFLNAKLFDGTLPDLFIVYSRRARSGGHYCPKRYSGRGSDLQHDELSLNPDGFLGQTDEFIVSTLGHEMHHHWQEYFGKMRRANYAYHDKEWAAKMKSNGLMPSNNGMVGGKETGQRMSHYVIPGGPFAQAFAKLAATGWKLNLQSAPHAGATKTPPSKVKFTCPSCGSNMWGKPDSKDICGECNQWRLAAAADDGVAVQSYDQAA